MGAMVRLPGSERVASFDDLDAAETDCRCREEEARRDVNPFACGGPLCYQTSLDEGRLHDWVLDLGLEPPEPGTKAGWRTWWDKHHKSMTDLQKAKIWEALDKVRFFRVVESSSRILFMVAGAYCKYNDEYYYTEADGLTPYKAFRTREEAEVERDEMEENARDVMDMHPFQINALCQWEAWSSLSQEEAVERVKALGLPPPEPRHGKELNWEDWWDQTEMTYWQREEVWDLLDKIRFWEVIEVEVPE
jgi:hypothetical protein